MELWKILSFTLLHSSFNLQWPTKKHNVKKRKHNISLSAPYVVTPTELEAPICSNLAMRMLINMFKAARAVTGYV